MARCIRRLAAFGLVQTGRPPPGPPPTGLPEPAAWALMLAGFAMAGAALRRRRTAMPAT